MPFRSVPRFAAPYNRKFVNKSLISGVTGNADEAVDSFLQGNLELMTGDSSARAGGCGAGTLQNLTLSSSPLSSAKTGAIILHGWHHSAQKSMRMRPGSRSTSSSKFSSVSVTISVKVRVSTYGAVVQDRHTLTGMVGVHEKADIKAMLEQCKA